MIFVVDANILFSALIRDGYIRKFLLLGNHEFYTSEYIIEEIGKHLDILCEKTLLSEKDLKELLYIFIDLSRMKIVPIREYKEFIKRASEISPDLDDVHYFALALKLNCTILSQDKKLKEQKDVKVYSMEDLR